MDRRIVPGRQLGHRHRIGDVTGDDPDPVGRQTVLARRFAHHRGDVVSAPARLGNHRPAACPEPRS
ncbi:hypothetical protein BAY59_11440 [Prauserella coralliicola]|nr:hypothetical protein BAY59_11440 [Prauserella coralliicola]